MFGKETPRYDLRLDKSCIFIPVRQSPGSHASVTGSFCFSLPENIWVKVVKVRLRGTLKITRNNDMVTEDRELITYKEEQVLASSRTQSSFQVPAGDYEFLFDIPLPSDLYETSIGPEHNYHTYQLGAIIERRYRRDIVVSQALSIYRLPDMDPSHLYADSPLTIGGESEQGIEHSTSIPSSAIPFGSIVSVECGFKVPSKDVKLSAITLEVIENHHLRLEATATQAALNILNINSSRTYTLFKVTRSPTQQSELVSCTGTEWFISPTVCLPRSLALCSQSVRTKTITITHSLVVTAEFHNDNGQVVDTIVNTIPFSIYMAPGIIRPDGNVSSKIFEYNTFPPPPNFWTMRNNGRYESRMGFGW
ncbi:uncharacterized protein BO97DRAFT_420908 [Aspergillus homomorphus CBS 101889]|uniref:Uncharacterized protein n=1 Tax=Aspergillus homomorphus (strain CBS 101889) TaxID=1450537 RepID=A0A395I9B3_ASPHC|nr:hypothetical protein BO97DRAFT_420908 [Aspergillus homomorphus CBS 101889]RAL16606.1 hypothetical protein BO97DRAFT_420908 [Aspergillus homomorphus CBS 101889]